MRISGKALGAMTAIVAGSLIFLAPDMFTGERLMNGTIPVDRARAQSIEPADRAVSKIEAADDAYFEAALAIERGEEISANLTKLEAADDAYFEAVIALETTEESARHIARIEAADNDYFEAAMALEVAEVNARQLADLIAREAGSWPTVVATSNETGAGEIVTGALSPGADKKPVADPLAAEIARLKAADDAYFDAVLSLEAEGEKPETLATLKSADDAYFDAVIAIETITAERKAKKAQRKMKLASRSAAAPAPAPDPAAAPTSAESYGPKVAARTAPAPVTVRAPAPLPPRRRAVKTYMPRQVRPSTVTRHAPQPQKIGPLRKIFRIVTFPIAGLIARAPAR